jgi:hypothetical protein
MFHDNLVTLLKELNLGDASDIDREERFFSIELQGTEIVLQDEPPGLHFFSKLAELPETNQEEICTKLLRGNFLGQATKRAGLGLTEDGKHIVANAFYPTIKSYREFREAVEDFVNVVSYWRKEAGNR